MKTGWEPNGPNDNTDWHPVEGVEYANRRFLNGYTLWVRAPELELKQNPFPPDSDAYRLFGGMPIVAPKYWLWQAFDRHNQEVAGGKTRQNIEALYAADSFAGGDTTLYERILHGKAKDD